LKLYSVLPAFKKTPENIKVGLDQTNPHLIAWD